MYDKKKEHTLPFLTNQRFWNSVQYKQSYDVSK
jgi:hypothetical protein